MKDKVDRCAKCRKANYPLFQIPGGKYVCPRCVPATAFTGYPGFKKKVERLIQKGAYA